MNAFFGFFVKLLMIAAALSWKPAKIPDYCSRDKHFRHKIPQLSEAENQRVGLLKQVQVMLRHGARTPYSQFSCWEDYDIPWNNCNVTQLSYVSSTVKEKKHPLLFRKLYDGSENLLGGNCLTGQLIPEGLAQEQENGRILAAAYLHGPENKRLFPSSEWSTIDPSALYFRADDDSSARVIMSGEVALGTMFNFTKDTVIDIHTGDYSLDQIYPNAKVCPRMDVVRATAYASDEWLAYNSSSQAKELTRNLTMLFGENKWTWGNLLDCVMTAVCTGHDIPSRSRRDRSVRMTDAIFDGAVSHFTKMFSFPAR